MQRYKLLDAGQHVIEMAHPSQGHSVISAISLARRLGDESILHADTCSLPAPEPALSDIPHTVATTSNA